MATLKVSKLVDNLPGTLAGNHVYLVKKGESVEMFLTDNTGTTAYQINEPPPHPFLFLAAITQGAS